MVVKVGGGVMKGADHLPVIMILKYSLRGILKEQSFKTALTSWMTV